MDNLEEFKALMKRYESITEEEIRTAIIKIKEVEGNEWFGDNVMGYITGFGVTDRCTLCSKLDFFNRVYSTEDPRDVCKNCTWANPNVDTGSITYQFCTFGVQQKTYEYISHARSIAELLEAAKYRAEHMHKHLALLGIEE